VKKEWPNGNSKLSHLSKWWKRNGQMGTVNWVTWANSEKWILTPFSFLICLFLFLDLLKWLNLLFPFVHSFFTICSSDSIYCSHLAIPFSPLAQVTQFTVPIWPFIFHYFLKFTWASGEKWMAKWNSKLSHLSKWWKTNGQMGTVNWVTWGNSEKGMAKWEQEIESPEQVVKKEGPKGNRK
jgi:hypothetical protein